MLNRILYYYKKELKLLFVFLFTSFIVTLLDLATPVYIQKLVDKTIPEKNINELVLFSMILALSYVMRYFISLYSSSRGQLMGNKIKFHMRNDLFRKIMDQPAKFFQEKKSGDLISRVVNDLESISSLMYRGVEELFFTGLAVLGAVYIMASSNLKLTIITMIPMPFAVYFVFHQNNRLKVTYKNIRNFVSDLTSMLHDSLKNIFFIKNYLLENEKKEYFYRESSKVLQGENENITNTSILMSGINLYNQFTQLIIIFAGGYLHMTEGLSLGIIMSFIILTNRFRIYIMKLLSLVDIYQRGVSGMERFNEIIDIHDPESTGELLTGGIESIEFKNVSFSYSDSPLLSNISFKITKGEKVAFVGKTGIGKSTIFSLLKGEIIPEQGEILINEKNIHQWKREGYMKKLGIVDQSDHVLSKNLIENIRIVNTQGDLEEVVEAMKFAYIDHLSDLPQEDTGKMSSGEKQRLALARIFYKKPEVILLDEATSALDNITEKNILENMQNEFSNKIILTIAHRLRSLKNFDRIYVLNSGKIVESGSYEELMDMNGAFSLMEGNEN